MNYQTLFRVAMLEAAIFTREHGHREGTASIPMETTLLGTYFAIQEESVREGAGGKLQ